MQSEVTGNEDFESEVNGNQDAPEEFPYDGPESEFQEKDAEEMPKEGSEEEKESEENSEKEDDAEDEEQSDKENEEEKADLPPSIRGEVSENTENTHKEKSTETEENKNASKEIPEKERKENKEKDTEKTKTESKSETQLTEKQIADARKAGKENLEEKANAKKNYSRPGHWRSGMRDEVWENAKDKHGRVRDPNTGRYMSKDQPWDMGHKPGYEFRKHQKSAEERGIDRKQFLDEYFKTEHYRPELPESNRSHKGENMTEEYFGD